MKVNYLIGILIIVTQIVTAQSDVVTLSEDMMTRQQELLLAEMDGWVFKSGSMGFSNNEISTDEVALKPIELSSDIANENGRIEGWFRLKFRLDESLKGLPLFIARDHLISSDVYINNELVASFGVLGTNQSSFKSYDPFNRYAIPITINYDSVNVLDMHIAYYQDLLTPRDYRLKDHTLKTFINITGPKYQDFISSSQSSYLRYSTMWISVVMMFMVVFWLLYFHNRDEQIFLYISILSTFIFILVVATSLPYIYSLDLASHKFRLILSAASGALMTVFNLIVIEYIIKKQISKLSKTLVAFLTLTSIIAHLYDFTLPYALFNSVLWLYFIYLIWTNKSKITQAQWAVVLGMVLTIIGALIYTSLHKISLDIFRQYQRLVFTAVVFASPIPLLYYVAKRFQELIRDAREKTEKVIRLSHEKEQILSDQNKYLEAQVEERTSELKTSLHSLKTTQNQLIHAEKMASLGELTAGIAHEIQNPLNFVNNFSEVSGELLDEVVEELEAGDVDEAKEIIGDIRDNLEKISHHGHRASGIVNSMLDHSRSSSGEEIETDINALCDEYLRLAYHGMRAKDRNFNADFETDFDPKMPKIKVVPQDIGRVLLNLINNAFQAINNHKVGVRAIQSDITASPESGKLITEGGKVTVSTKYFGDQIEISVQDNGPGIPDNIRNKIFQPFFTTKPTGQGTGLGLSLSYDIIKSHGGTININSQEGQGTTFIINLPVSNQ